MSKFDSLLKASLEFPSPILPDSVPVDSMLFHIGGKTEPNVAPGYRLSVNIHTVELTYLKEQLAQYYPKGDDVVWLFNVSGYLTGWDYYLELETGYSFGPSYSVFLAGAAREIDIGIGYCGLWLRRGFNDIFRSIGTRVPQIDMLPGISIAYIDATVSMGKKEGEDEFYDQILAGRDWCYAAGVMVRWHVFFIEYRYHWWEITDTWTRNGGEFFFPGNPILDLSGHFFGFGIGGDGKMNGGHNL